MGSGKIQTERDGDLTHQKVKLEFNQRGKKTNRINEAQRVIAVMTVCNMLMLMCFYGSTSVPMNIKGLRACV